MKTNNPLRDKLDDDNLDLSLSQMSEVTEDVVTNISLLPKGTNLDLSNNLLLCLPESFCELTHLTRLDLSKNRLQDLPEYFGNLRSLKQLDLYSNELEHLPVTLGQLKNLKFLDLKNNPLSPAIQKAAGPCITSSDCQQCAKKVVALYQSMQSQLERERQKRAIEEEKVKAAVRAAEEAERERIRVEKRAAKERRREEANAVRSRMAAAAAMANDGHQNGRGRQGTYSDGSIEREMERRPNDTSSGDGRGSRSFCRSLFMFLLGLLFVMMASGFALLWVYAGGDLSAKNIRKTMPVLRRDVDAYFLTVGKKAEVAFEGARPYVKDLNERASANWEELCRRTKLLNRYINTKLGPTVCSAVGELKRYFATAQVWVRDAWTDWVKPAAWDAWTWLRPHFQALGEAVLAALGAVADWAKANGPAYYDWAATKAAEAYKSVQGMING